MDTYTNPQTDPAPLPKLHDDVATALAVFLGGPLAGGVILRSNFAALGRSRLGNIAFILSVAYILFIVGLTIIVPDIFKVVALLSLFGLNPVIYYYLNYVFFDKDLEVRKLYDHNAIHPMWKGIAIGIMAGILVSAVGFIYGTLSPLG